MRPVFPLLIPLWVRWRLSLGVRGGSGLCFWVSVFYGLDYLGGGRFSWHFGWVIFRVLKPPVADFGERENRFCFKVNSLTFTHKIVSCEYNGGPYLAHPKALNSKVDIKKKH